MSQTTTVDPAATTTTTDGGSTTATVTVTDPKTVLADPGKEGSGASVASAWPEDWRDRMAMRDGTVDPKFRKQLDRFAEPAAVGTSYAALWGRVDRGEFVSKLPADAKPEEVAEWRTANGIPDKPEGYLDKLPDGLIIGEQDKPLINEFLAGIHASNAPPAVAHAALASYYRVQEHVAHERSVADNAFAEETIDALRAEWGADYRGNMNAASAIVESLAPKGTLTKIMESRLDGGGGRPLASDPDVIRFLALIAREINPASTIVPGAGASAGKSIDDRIAEIEGLMGNRGSDYWRGPKSEGMQAEFRQLIEARERTRARAG